MVSDFYTPQYFDPVKSNGVRYSFSGSVRGPGEVLDGGYLSGFDPQTRHLFQLQVDGDTTTIDDKGEIPFEAESLRTFSDRVSVDRRDSVIKGGSRAGLRLSATSRLPQDSTDKRAEAYRHRPGPGYACPQSASATGAYRSGALKICAKGGKGMKRCLTIAAFVAVASFTTSHAVALD